MPVPKVPGKLFCLQVQIKLQKFLTKSQITILYFPEMPNIESTCPTPITSKEV